MTTPDPSTPEVDEARPLADRMRPANLDEMVGQRHLLAPDKPLRRPPIVASSRH
jgi:putative ATPase